MNIYDPTLHEYSVTYRSITYLPSRLPSVNPRLYLIFGFNCLYYFHPVRIRISSNRSYIYIYIPKYRLPRTSTYLNTLLHYLINIVTIRILTFPYTLPLVTTHPCVTVITEPCITYCSLSTADT